MKSASRWQKCLGLVLIASFLACCSLLPFMPGGQAHAATRPGSAVPLVSGSTIASIAEGQIGGTCGDYYGCPDPGEWCSDFARWVWQQAGAYNAGLSAASGSFYVYGLSQGTLSSTPHVGDAVIFDYGYQGYGTASHVALVVSVDTSNHTIYSVGGNEGGGAGVVQKDGPYNWAIGTSLAGERISGYASPVGSSFGSSGAEEVGAFDSHASSFWIDGKNQSGKQVGHCLVNSNPNGETVLSNWWWVGQVRIAYYHNASCTYPSAYYGQVYIHAPTSMADGHICTANYDPNNQTNLITNCG